MWSHFVVEGYCQLELDDVLVSEDCDHIDRMTSGCPGCKHFVFCASDPIEALMYVPAWRLIWWKGRALIRHLRYHWEER